MVFSSVHLSFIVHGLKTGREYVFRLKSVSQAGNSNYSDESPSIRVKAAISKYTALIW